MDADPLTAEELVSWREMADLLGVKHHTFRSWLDGNRVPGRKLDRNWYCVPAQVVFDIARPLDGSWRLGWQSTPYAALQRRLRAAGYGQTPPKMGAAKGQTDRYRTERPRVFDFHERTQPEIQVVQHTPRPRPNEPRIVTAKELAEILKVSTATIYKLSKAGKIPTLPLGGRKRYDLDDILDRLEQSAREPGAPPARPLRRR